MFTYANEALSIKICANLHNLHFYIKIEMLWYGSPQLKKGQIPGDWYTNFNILSDCRLKLLLSNFVYENSIVSAQTNKEPSILNCSTCLNPPAGNVRETVRRRSFIVLMLLMYYQILVLLTILP